MNDEAIQSDVSEIPDNAFGASRAARLAELDRDRRSDSTDPEDSAEDAFEAVSLRATDLADALANNGFNDDDEAHDDYPMAAESAPATAGPVYAKNGEYYTQIKVDGQIKEVPFQQLIATAQKHDSADRRLQELAFERQQLAQERAEIDAARAQIYQPPAKGAEHDPERKELARQYHEALTDGDDERAAELLLDLNGTGRHAPTLDYEQIAAQAAERAYAAIRQEQTQREWQQARSRFDREFSDITGNIDLFRTADQMTQAVMAENPTLSMWEILSEAGQRVRAMQAPTAQQRPIADARQERKARLPSVGSTSARTAAQPADQVDSREAYLNKQRAARGQSLRG